MTDYDETDIDDGDARLTDADQEVLAQRRAGRAPVDSAGYQRTGHPVRYGTQDVVTKAPCRECRTMVEVTETGLFTFKTASAYLVSKGERPLKVDEVFVCETCMGAVRHRIAAHGRKVVDKLAWCVRVLRDGGTQEDEIEAVRYLDKNDNERCDAGERSATVKYWSEKRAQKRGSKADY